jgi:hypothetical protein
MDCGVLGLWFSFPHPPHPTLPSYPTLVCMYALPAHFWPRTHPPPPPPPDLAEKNHKAHGMKGLLCWSACARLNLGRHSHNTTGGGGGEDQPHHYSLTRLFTHPVHQYTPQPPIHTSATNTHLSHNYTPLPPTHTSATNTRLSHQCTPQPPMHTLSTHTHPVHQYISATNTILQPPKQTPFSYKCPCNILS